MRDPDFALLNPGYGIVTPSRQRGCPIVFRPMPSATYELFRRAILSEMQIHCVYHGRRRALCPHILGYKDGEEKVLAFQFAGESHSRLPPGGEWRCFRLAEVRNPDLRAGPWHEGSQHRLHQSCIDEVELDVNVHVRKAR